MVEVPDRLGAWGLEPTFAASRLLPAEALPKVLARYFHRGFAQWREPRSRSVSVSATSTASPDCSLAPGLENGRRFLCARVQQVYYHLTPQCLQLRVLPQHAVPETARCAAAAVVPVIPDPCPARWLRVHTDVCRFDSSYLLLTRGGPRPFCMRRDAA